MKFAPVSEGGRYIASVRAEIKITDTTDPAALADWVEFNIFWFNKGISRAKLGRLIESTDSEEPPDDLLDSVWAKLSERLRLYGPNKPFKVCRHKVDPEFSWRTRPEYLFMLALSLFGNPPGRDKHTTTARLFERLSKEATVNYLGGGAVIFGYPKKIGVREIAELISEDFLTEPASAHGDQKNDIVAWRDTNDGRGTKVVVLMQCAAGHNWEDKLCEPSIFLWQSFINFGVTMPMKGFSMPGIVDRDRYMGIAKQAGLIFDRARIYRFTTRAVARWGDKRLRDDLIAWGEKRIPDLVK